MFEFALADYKVAGLYISVDDLVSVEILNPIDQL